MQLILKRLELIKTAISIEDEEIIRLQLDKFDSSTCDDEINSILEKVKNKDYGEVAVLIDEYLKRYSGVMVYEDKELQGLKFELKALESKLQDLDAEKNKYLDDIRMFNDKYHLVLGEIIKDILKAKERLLYKAFMKKSVDFHNARYEYEELKEEYEKLKAKKEAKEKELESLDEFDDRYDECYEELQELKLALDELENELNLRRKRAKKAKEEMREDGYFKEHEEVRHDFKEFSKEYEEVKNKDVFELNDEELKELKTLYKKAARLCHPDVVADEFKQKAMEIFYQLNLANEKQDLQAVKDICANLIAHGFSFTSDITDDKNLLKNKISNLRENIQIYETDIETIKEDETYKILCEHEDIDEYLDGLKVRFENEYESIVKRIEEKDEEKTTKNVDNEYILDDYDVKYIYHMTHYKNLKSILENGLLSHGNKFVTQHIDNKDVNSRRNKKEPINGENLHSYVPFYFNPKNPMLFVNRDFQNGIVILAFDRSLLLKGNMIFTDGNAAVRTTKFFDDLQDFDKLNWECLRGEYWSDFEDGKRQRMAEVLIYKKVDIKYLQHVFCMSEEAKEFVESLDNSLDVRVARQLYF